MSWLEIYLSSTAFLLLFIYHIHLISQLSKASMTTSIGLTNYLRLDWVQSVRCDNWEHISTFSLPRRSSAAGFYLIKRFFYQKDMF